MKFKSKQEIFEYVIKFLIKQGKRSYNENGGECMYRNPEGLMCAIGCILSDDVYSPKMEGKRVNYLIETYKHIPKYIKDNKYFLIYLQYLHDCTANWGINGLRKKVIVDFAKRHDLSIEFLKET